VTNKASEIINSSVLGLDPQYQPGWYGDPFYNQINMTVFNNNLYFSGTEPVGGQGIPNCGRPTPLSIRTARRPPPWWLAAAWAGGFNHVR
jgi:hypothetical protein